MRGIFFRDINADHIGHIMWETYGARAYDYFLTRKDMTILEVGGNVGAVTLYLAQYAKHLYVMEPCKEHLQLLRKTVKFNKLNNVTIIPYALDTESKTKPFFKNPANTTAHTLKDDCGLKNFVNVKCLSLSDVIDKYNIGKIDFMKLDVEGKEIEILAGTSFAKEAKKIDSMVIEYHKWAGDPSLLETALSKCGYNWEKAKLGANLYGAVRAK